jgi:putative ABC transport system permease protein
VGQSLGVHNHDVTKWVWLDVVGVVGDVHPPLSEGEPKPFVYLPSGEPNGQLGLLVARGRGTDAELMRNIRATIARIDPEAAVTRSRPLVEAIEEVRYPRRMAAALLVSSALVGLLLASVGLYGVVSYSVVQRLKELGIRAALGADRADLTRLVVREAANVTVIGSLIGFGLAFVGIRLVSHQVFAMPGLDWITAAVVPAVLGVVVFAACYLPARRAARVDPLVVLRWQ